MACRPRERERETRGIEEGVRVRWRRDAAVQQREASGFEGCTGQDARTHLEAIAVVRVEDLDQTGEDGGKEGVHLGLEVSCERRDQAQERGERWRGWPTQRRQEQIEDRLLVEEQLRQRLDERRDRPDRVHKRIGEVQLAQLVEPLVEEASIGLGAGAQARAGAGGDRARGRGVSGRGRRGANARTQVRARTASGTWAASANRSARVTSRSRIRSAKLVNCREAYAGRGRSIGRVLGLGREGDGARAG